MVKLLVVHFSCTTIVHFVIDLNPKRNLCKGDECSQMYSWRRELFNPFTSSEPTTSENQIDNPLLNSSEKIQVNEFVAPSKCQKENEEIEYARIKKRTSLGRT